MTGGSQVFQILTFHKGMKKLLIVFACLFIANTLSTNNASFPADSPLLTFNSANFHFSTGSALKFDMNFRSIVREKLYHAFEETYGADSVWFISKRSSKDGLTFQKRGSSLLQRGPEGSFDRYGQADPTVIMEGPNDWKMWFDALDSQRKWSSIGYATSKDGETWVKHGPVLDKGNILDWDGKSIHHPVCIKWKGLYYMFYSGSSVNDPHIVKNIGVAISTDGVHFFKFSENPIVVTGSDWDRNYVRPSRPVLINGVWYMFYWGYNGIERSIGIATSQDLLHWTKQGKLFGSCFTEDSSPFNNPTASDVMIRNNKIQLWYSTYTNSGSYLHFATCDIP